MDAQQYGMEHSVDDCEHTHTADCRICRGQCHDGPYVRWDFTCEEAERLYAYKLAVQAGLYSEGL